MRYRQTLNFNVWRLIVAALFLSLGTMLALPPALSRDPNVLPGKSVGHISLGMRQADVRRSLGNSQRTYSLRLGAKSGLPVAWQGEYAEDEWQSAQGKYQLDVTYRRGRVAQIGTTNPAYTAEGGISAGSTGAALRRHFPRMTVHQYQLNAPGTPPDESTSYFVDSAARGIGFEFGVPDNTSFADTVATSQVDTLYIHATGAPLLPIYRQFAGEQYDAKDDAEMKRLRAYLHG